MKCLEKRYTVDLSLPPEERWEELIWCEGDKACKLILNCVAEAKEVAQYNPWARKFFEAIQVATAILRSPMHNDMYVWSKVLGIDFIDVTMANLIYEVSQIPGCFNLRAYGCTSIAYCQAYRRGTMVHTRNLDWPCTGIGRSSIIIEYVGCKNPYTVIGWPGSPQLLRQLC